jgi:hypothetical protein
MDPREVNVAYYLDILHDKYVELQDINWHEIDFSIDKIKENDVEFTCAGEQFELTIKPEGTSLKILCGEEEGGTKILFGPALKPEEEKIIVMRVVEIIPHLRLIYLLN